MRCSPRLACTTSLAVRRCPAPSTPHNGLGQQRSDRCGRWRLRGRICCCDLAPHKRADVIGLVDWLSSDEAASAPAPLSHVTSPLHIFHFYEQCISGERRSCTAGAVSRKPNAALSIQSGAFCVHGRRPKSSRAGSHHNNAAQDVWSGEILTESPLQESGAELLRQNTAARRLERR